MDNSLLHTHSHNKVSDVQTKYYCPMHCEGDKVYDEPGNCPVCGMQLVPVQDERNKKHEHHQHQKDKPSVGATGKYYCPMHCEGDKVYDKPGNCPVCGMNLEKLPSVQSKNVQYTCPMHPEIIRDAPGSYPKCAHAVA